MLIRYLRVWSNGSSANSGNHWYKIRLYDQSGTLVSNGCAVSSNGVEEDSSTRPMTGITDESSWFWCGITNEECLIYCQIDLGSIQDINKIQSIQYYEDGRTYYNVKVEVSQDGENWVLIYSAKASGRDLQSIEEGLVLYLNNHRGILYNGYNVSRNPAHGEHVYYNDSDINNIYVNGSLVWDKVTPLDFIFNGPRVIGYTGSASSFTIPTSYSTTTDTNGILMYVEGSDFQVTIIGDDAFEGLTSLTSVTIPSTITAIGARAFQFCYNLSTVNVSATPTSIGYCAFALTNLSSISSYLYYCTSLGQGCFASRQQWFIQTNTTRANNLLGTNLGVLSNDGYTGQGYIYAATPVRVIRHVAGSQTPTGDYEITSYMNGHQIMWGGGSIGTSGSTSSVYVTNGTSTPSYTMSYSGSGTNIDSVAQEITHSNNSAGVINTVTYYLNITSTCLVEGTPILLSDGSTKKIEDLTYEDLLMIWNFETGSYDYQYPLAIIKGNTYPLKYRLTLEDNSFIDICGRHDIYDPVAHKFRIYGNGAIHKLDQDYYVLQYINSKTYACRKIISIETIYEKINSYSVITSGTITAFANNIMIGLSTLNLAPINNSNSFEKEFQKDKELCYTYNRFKEEIYSNSSKYLILGLNLHYVDYYNKDTSGLPCLLNPFNFIIKPETKNNKYVCTIGLLDGDTLIESQHLEDEEIILPEIKSELKTHWYIVGEYKYLKPGDKYKINFSTLIRAV